MLTGVLVVAFPVSVFSDLWSKEVKRINREMRIINPHVEMLPDDEDDDYVDDNDSDNDNGSDDGSANIHLLAKGSTDTNNYDTSRAKDFNKLMSNMSFSRLMQNTPDTASTRKRESANDDNVPNRSSISMTLDHGDVKQTITKSVVLNNTNINANTSANTNTSDSDNDKNTLTIKREDMTEILDRLDTIRENELRIRSLFQKYQL